MNEVWFKLQPGCRTVPWQGEWVPIGIRLGRGDVYTLTHVDEDTFREAVSNEKSALIEGLPLIGAIFDDFLHLHPKPKKAYGVVRLQA